jgi:2-keto-3-deoxy-L-rhamnonate aldolase RhmA
MRTGVSRDSAGATVGGWMQLPNLEIVEAIAKCGYDFVGLDLQHGAHDFRFALNALQLIDALGLPSVARIQPSELFLLARLADYGLGGVVIAMCDTPEIIRSAVVAARYQPDGMRSYAGQRLGLRLEKANLADEGPEIYAMIETRGGLDGLKQILSVPGVAGVHVGRADLSLALGIDFRDDRNDRILDPVKRILDTTREADLHAAIHVGSGEEAHFFIEMGFDQIVLGADIALLRQAFANALAIARQATSASSRARV